MFWCCSASAQRQHWCGGLTDLWSPDRLLAGRLSSCAGSTGRTSDPNGPTQTWERGMTHYKPLLTNRDRTTRADQMLVCSVSSWNVRQRKRLLNTHWINISSVCFRLQSLNAKSIRTVLREALTDLRSAFLHMICEINT